MALVSTTIAVNLKNPRRDRKWQLDQPIQHLEDVAGQVQGLEPGVFAAE